MADFLDACVKGRLNIIVSGGTGTGKTTALNVLSSFIPSDERIVTVEDAKELQLHQDHVLPLESRPPNIEGKGEVRIRDLVRNSLRMRPDRIVVGECRGGEALDMLQAMNTGHDGSLTTVHANSPRDTLSRIETMVLMAGMDLPVRAIREQMASAVDLIVQLQPPAGRQPADHARQRGAGHGGRRHRPPGPLHVRLRDGRRRRRPVPGSPQDHRHPAEVRREARRLRHPSRPRDVRRRSFARRGAWRGSDEAPAPRRLSPSGWRPSRSSPFSRPVRPARPRAASSSATSTPASTRRYASTCWSTAHEPKLSDFTVRENSKVIPGGNLEVRPLKQTAKPIGTVLVIDTSGSMKPRIDEAQGCGPQLRRRQGAQRVDRRRLILQPGRAAQ